MTTFPASSVKCILKEGLILSNEYKEREFEKNYLIILMIRKMVLRFFSKGSINERLIINHLIISLNYFGIVKVNIGLRMLCNDDQFSIIKSFLLFLNSFVLNDSLKSNRIVDDLLKDLKIRYSLS